MYFYYEYLNFESLEIVKEKIIDMDKSQIYNTLVLSIGSDIFFRNIYQIF